MRSYDELVSEAAAVPIAGWDFSWLDGRATEERPSWGYQRLLGERLAGAGSALDLQTGGGEVLAGVPVLPPTMVATEGWPPNLERATELLGPRGVEVVPNSGEPPLPFADETFDLVTSRHPVRPWFAEIHRVLRRGGTYFAQHVGPASAFELIEHFHGPLSLERHRPRHPDVERSEAEAAGLEVVDLRHERLRMEFWDVGAVVYFLRRVVWLVPDFSVERYDTQLRTLDARIRDEGPFVAHSSRVLIEARRPVEARASRTS